VVSWAFLGELIDSSTMAGLLAIFVGFALVKRAAIVRVVATVKPGLGIGNG